MYVQELRLSEEPMANSQWRIFSRKGAKSVLSRKGRKGRKERRHVRTRG